MGCAGLIQSVLGALREAGIPLAGTCRGEVPEADRLRFAACLGANLHGPLGYMAKTARLRSDLRAFLPWARGVFVVALPYDTSRSLSAHSVARGRAWVSRYAWGRDYHKVLRAKMKPAARLLEEAGHQARICVDSAPVLERALAARAGLGFIGKNGCLVHPRYGSYLFLGELFTDLALPDGEAVESGCGECELCLKACPAHAFSAPGVLDAGRCLSTWTIEWRGEFPPEVPPLRGHLFGCDRCQEVCPFNREAPLSDVPDFRPREPWFAPETARVAAMGEREWDAATRGTALRRARFEGLLRNAKRVLAERRGPSS